MQAKKKVKKQSIKAPPFHGVLPDGNRTQDTKIYLAAWNKFNRTIERALPGWTVWAYEYEPGVSLRHNFCTPERLSISFARRIVEMQLDLEALRGKDTWNTGGKKKPRKAGSGGKGLWMSDDFDAPMELVTSKNDRYTPKNVRRVPTNLYPSNTPLCKNCGMIHIRDHKGR